MDLSKIPVEKLLYFVAGVIPGFAALLIYQVAVPSSFTWFFRLGFFGYRTKLAIILLVAFVIGNSMTRFLSAIFGAIGGVIGTLKYKPSHTFEVAPWRDPTWRSALSGVVRNIPHNTEPITQRLYDLKVQEIQLLPELERPVRLAELNLAKIKSEREDAEWARWYDHYHTLVVQPADRDFFFHVGKGIHFNLETTAVYLLISAMIIPGVRRWWCLLPAWLWVVILLAEELSGLQQWANKWSTHGKQITYLTELSRASGNNASGNVDPSH